MNPISIYLAGPFDKYGNYPDWRDYIKEKIPEVHFFDPRFDTKQGCIAVFVSGDLGGVEQCDCTLTYVKKPHGDTGTTIETTHANAKDKLTILCLDKEIGFVSPMIIGISRRVLVGFDAAILYIKNLASVGLQNEFEAAYRTMNMLQ